MKSLLSHKKYIGGIFLFFFLFSANALLYSSHFVEEFGHDDHSVTSHYGDSNAFISSAKLASNHLHDGDQGEHHEDEESCRDGHSHSFNLYNPICYKYVPHNISRAIIEPFTFIPKVFLDKFIPPQNLV